MLSTKLLVVFFAFQSSVLASLNLHGQPLFSGVTEFTFEVATSTLTKATPCYITEGKVSQCRRKRGMEEKPQIQSEGLDIAPSAVMGYNCFKWFIFDLNYLLTLCCIVELKLHRPRVPQNSIRKISRIKSSPAHLTILILTIWTSSVNWRLQTGTMSSRSAIVACRRWISVNSFPVWEWLSKKRQHWRPLLRRPPPSPPGTTQWQWWAALRQVSPILTVLQVPRKFSRLPK